MATSRLRDHTVYPENLLWGPATKDALRVDDEVAALSSVCRCTGVDSTHFLNGHDKGLVRADYGLAMPISSRDNQV